MAAKKRVKNVRESEYFPYSRGKNCRAGFCPERVLDLRNASGDRESPSPTLSAISMCDPHDFNRRSASAVAGPHHEITGMDKLLGACPAGAECIAAGKNTISPSFFLSRELSVWAPLPRHVFLYNFILFYIHSQYACANIKLCESSSTSSTSTSSEEDRHSVKPFLRGGKNRGAGFRSQRVGAWSDGTGSRSPREPTLHASLPIRPHTNGHHLDRLHIWFRAWYCWRCSPIAFRRRTWSYYRGIL